MRSWDTFAKVMPVSCVFGCVNMILGAELDADTLNAEHVAFSIGKELLSSDSQRL